MQRLLALATVFSLGCALTQNGAQQMPTAIWARSHNISSVDVYLLCGDRNAEWLGVVGAKQREAFEIRAGYPYCVQGLNFFLVVRRTGRGYSVGPFRQQRGAQVELVIEKYAGLSSGRLVDGRP
jgi:hypothetical protein